MLMDVRTEALWAFSSKYTWNCVSFVFPHVDPMAVCKSNKVENTARTCNSALLMQRDGCNMHAQIWNQMRANTHVRLGNGSKDTRSHFVFNSYQNLFIYMHLCNSNVAVISTSFDHNITSRFNIILYPINLALRSLNWPVRKMITCLKGGVRLS